MNSVKLTAPVKIDKIKDILTRDTTGLDVAENRISTQDGTYISYSFTGIKPHMFASGIARKSLHLGVVDIYGHPTEQQRRKVTDLLTAAGIKVNLFDEAYDPEQRRKLLRIEFQYDADNPKR